MCLFNKTYKWHIKCCLWFRDDYKISVSVCCNLIGQEMLLNGIRNLLYFDTFVVHLFFLNPKFKKPCTFQLGKMDTTLQMLSLINIYQTTLIVLLLSTFCKTGWVSYHGSIWHHQYVMTSWHSSMMSSHASVMSHRPNNSENSHKERVPQKRTNNFCIL